MNRLIRDFRLIPVVLVAISALFVLKSTGLIFNGGYTLNSNDGDITGTVQQRPQAAPAPLSATETPAPLPPRSWAQQMFNFPEVTGVGRRRQQGGAKGEVQAGPEGSAAEPGRNADTARRRAHPVAGRARGAGTAGRAAHRA